MIISWDIKQLWALGPDNEVLKAYYTVTAEENGVSKETYGDIVLRAADPNTMIPYENLTCYDVIQWVQKALGDEKVQEIERLLTIEVKNQESGILQIKPLPWVQIQEESETLIENS